MPKKTTRTGKSRGEVKKSHEIGSSQQIDNLNIDSDEEYINSLPDIEIPGVDGPSLELELPSDDDRVSVSSYKTPEQNSLFAEGNFKQFYNNISEKPARAPRCESPLEDRPAVTAQVIDDFIANIGKNNRSLVTPKSVPVSITKRSHAAGTPAARPGTRRAGPGTQNHPPKRSNNSQVASSDSDSDLEPIIPQYQRSEKAKDFHRNMWNLTHPKGAQLKYKDGRSDLATSNVTSATTSTDTTTSTTVNCLRARAEIDDEEATDLHATLADDDEFRESDLEFERVTKRILLIMDREKSKSKSVRGTLTTSNTASVITTTNGAKSSTSNRSSARARVSNEEATNLQAPSAHNDERGCRMQALLATTESTPILTENSHNLRPKRGNNRTNFVKLQKQSNANDDPKKVKKSHTVIAKPSQSIVITRSMKIKVENTETLPRRSRRIQDKEINKAKPTTSRNKAVSNNTKAGTSNAKGSSSKDSVVEEDSVAESSEQTITRRTRSSRKDNSYSK